MKWIVMMALSLAACVLLALVIGAELAEAQSPLETAEGASVMQMTKTVKRFSSADSTILRVSGVGGMERTGVMHAWKFTNFQMKAVGDSVNVRWYFYAGWCEPTAANAALADTTTYHFALKDSLDVTAAGEFSRQVSDWMPVSEYWYAKAVGLANNGKGTYFESGKAMRERY
jgi:hypothetical protein